MLINVHILLVLVKLPFIIGENSGMNIFTLFNFFLLQNEDGLSELFESVMVNASHNLKAVLSVLLNEFIGVLRKYDCCVSQWYIIFYVHLNVHCIYTKNASERDTLFFQMHDKQIAIFMRPRKNYILL